MKAKILRECLGLISKLVLIHFGDNRTAVARTNKVNSNAFDASGIFHDVYIKILCILCRLRNFDEIFQSPAILKFSPFFFTSAHRSLKNEVI